MFMLDLSKFSLLFLILVRSISMLYSSPFLAVSRSIYYDHSLVNNNSAMKLNISHEINKSKRKSVIKCDEYVDAAKKKILMFHPSETTPFSISVSCQPPINLLIAGGEFVTQGDFRHMAAIGWRNDNESIDYLCGGSLISEQWVLTAAHCTQHNLRGQPSVIRLGSSQLSDNLGQIIKISDIIHHPEYTPPKLYSDIALVKLYKPVTFDQTIRPACLPSQSHMITRAVWATGWGQISSGDYTGSDHLLKVRLDIVVDSKCVSAYGKSSVLPGGFSTSMICAGDSSGTRGRDTCKGDSGGPLQSFHPSYCLYEIVGITSFGKLCAMPGYPAVYTRISYYLDWIEGIVWP